MDETITFLQASCNGVHFDLSTRFTFAPFSIKKVAKGKEPSADFLVKKLVLVMD